MKIGQLERDLMNNTNNSTYISTKPFYEIAKRGFDIIFSILLFSLTIPVWLIAVVGIKTSSPGPVFYISNRVGMNGKLFSMYKFRSMHLDSNANEKSLRPDHDRIFKFGQFIRATKIDELPQLLNVLFGKMTVVGPRPAALDQVDITRSGKYKIINTLKPGLTSPSALYDYIYGDEILYETEYNEKVLTTRLNLDLFYLNKRGILYDFKIIIYTAICVFLGLFQVRLKYIYNELVNVAKNFR